MKTSPLLNNVRHRAMITPARPLLVLTTLIQINRVIGQFIVRLNYSRNGNCPLDLT